MFNLETAIAQWRRQMLAAGMKTTGLLDELESHLRDDIDQRLKTGMNVEQSFQAAVADIGQPEPIQREFRKNRPDKVHKVIGWAAVAMYSLCTLPLFFSPIIGATPSEKLIGFLALLVTAALTFGSDHAWRILPLIRAKSVRITVGIACAVLGTSVPMVLFKYVIPLFDATSAQIVLSVLWGLIPMLIGGAVLAGLNEAAKRRLA